MNITLKARLNTNEIQHRALLRTMHTFSDVCNDISSQAFEAKEYQKVQLHHIVYKKQREALPDFSSQLVVRAIGVVSDSYKVKRNRHQRNFFKRTSAVVYDDRVITFRDSGTVNIWTNDGRMEIPIQVYDKDKFKYRKGQVDLVYQNNKFYLLCTLDIPTESAYDAKGVIGVDLGVKNIAVTSDGDVFSGEHIEKKRKQYHSHKQRLQKRGTRSAKRRIKTTGQKESRFRKDVNHVISKLIVSKAKGTQMALALEELTHINKRVTVRKENRNERMSWAFAQLRGYITYKAELYGVPLAIVPARYTSVTCSECGHCAKANRKSQAKFLCMSCGHTENADFNASKNIAKLGEQSISLLLRSPSEPLVASHTPCACGS
jgi:IS605 OrfB family transposase